MYGSLSSKVATLSNSFFGAIWIRNKKFFKIDCVVHDRPSSSVRELNHVKMLRENFAVCSSVV